MVHYPLYDGLDPLGVDRFGKLMDAFSPIAIFASKPSRQQRPNRLKPVAIQLNSSSGMIFIFYSTIFLFFTLPLHYTPLQSTLLHTTPLHSTPMHYTPLHSILLQITSLKFTPLHSTPLQSTLLHSTPLHSIPLHTTPNYSTLI